MKTEIKVGDTVKDPLRGKEYFVNVVSYDGRLMHITQTTIPEAPSLPFSGWALTSLYVLVDSEKEPVEEDLKRLLAKFNYVVEKDRYINPNVDRENMGVLLHEDWRNKLKPDFFGKVKMLFSKDVPDVFFILIIHNTTPLIVK